MKKPKLANAASPGLKQQAWDSLSLLALTLLYLLFLFPMLLLLLSLLFLLGKISARHVYESLGLLSLDNFALPGGRKIPFLWMHASSYGEWHSLRPMAQLLKQETGMNIFLSYFNEELKKTVAKDELIDESAFLPIENPLALLWIVQQLNVKALLLMELEIWPLLLFTMKARGLPVFSLSAILFDDEAKRYRRFSWIFRSAFGSISRFYASSEETKRNLLAMGASPKRICLSPSLKFSLLAEGGREGKANENKNLGPLLSLIKKSKQQKLILASIHYKEFILLFSQLRSYLQSSEFLLIIAPRKLEDGAKFSQFLKKQKISSLIRQDKAAAISQQNLKLFSQTGNLLLLTLGELNQFYAASSRLSSGLPKNKKKTVALTVALIGGSFIPIGGHSVFQPLSQGIPVLIGSYQHSQREILSIAKDSVLTSKKKTFGNDLRQILANPPKPFSASKITRLQNAAHLLLPLLLADLQKAGIGKYSR